jgi:hypothetical protein
MCQVTSWSTPIGACFGSPTAAMAAMNGMAVLFPPRPFVVLLAPRAIGMATNPLSRSLSIPARPGPFHFLQRSMRARKDLRVRFRPPLAGELRQDINPKQRKFRYAGCSRTSGLTPFGLPIPAPSARAPTRAALGFFSDTQQRGDALLPLRRPAGCRFPRFLNLDLDYHSGEFPPRVPLLLPSRWGRTGFQSLPWLREPLRPGSSGRPRK